MSKPLGLELLAVILAVVLVASACGSTATDLGSDPGSSDPSDLSELSDSAEGAGAAEASPLANDDTSTGDAGETESGGDSSELDTNEVSMAASSPIGAFFAADGGFQAALDEYTARVNEQIVRCMAADGFEFIPDPTRGDNPVDQAQSDLTVRQWTTEYGYGISTSFDTIVENQTSNPNMANLFTMSESAREAWLDSLMGPDREGFDLDIGARPLEEQGCIGHAIIETGGSGAVEGLEELGDTYDEGEQAILDRTEMITAVEAWSQCMAESGYTGYGKLEDPEDDIDSRLRAITAPLSAALDNIDQQDARALIDGTSEGLEGLPGLDVEALRELQAEERKVALVDLDCYDAHVKETFEPLRDEFERGLMDTYSTQFEALSNIGN